MPDSRLSHIGRLRTTFRTRRWISVVAVFGFALATTDPALAQDSIDAESSDPLPADATRVGPPEGFEVINVKGRELTALESEVPTSVTQFNAEDIEALGAQNIADVSKVTPNVEIRTAGATSPTFFIRGVGLADFNANAAGAVAIYQDDVAINAPAMQLGILYDLVDVQVLRGPQGTGSGRNASAGAIKIYSRKPSGEFGAYLRSTYGNYNYLDFEGAVEAPLIEEVLATRLAFRYSQRDPYGRNGCGDAPPLESEARLPPITFPGDSPQIFGPVFCGNKKPGGSEERQRFPNPRAFPGSGQPPLVNLSTVPGGLPDRVNDLGRWAARGQLLFQPPDLEMSWMLNGHGQRIDELSTLGQMIGSGPQGLYGGYENFSSQAYRDPDVTQEAEQILADLRASGSIVPESIPPCQTTNAGAATNCMATALVGPILASGRPLDIRPHRGDYNRVGRTTLDVWGTFLRGDMTFGNVDVTTITAYDAYTRFRDSDQDFTPNVIFESITNDSAWQFSQELKAEVQLEEEPVGLEFGAYYLMEELEFSSSSFSTSNSQASVTERDYKQDIFSFGLFSRFAWDFLDNFTLEGGVRYNWERKSIAFNLTRDSPCVRPEACAAEEFRIWQAPTGELNLIYTFPDQDVQLIWKYARGWKSGHWNALATLLEIGVPVTPAEPETIDDFEMKLSGKWFDERVWLDASVFYYKYDQYQVFIIDSQPNQPPQLKIINANDAQVYGAEVTLVAQPLLGLVVEEVEGLRLEARFGWLESEFLDFTNDVYKVIRTGNFDSIPLSVPVDYSGNRLINSPQFKLSLTATWMFDLGRWGQIIPRYDGAWSSDIYFNQAEGRRTTQLDIPGVETPSQFPECAIGQCAFWLHNLRVDYMSPNGKIKIGGWVRNLEDTVYKTYGFDASEFGALTVAYVSEPRMYGLDFTVNW